VRRVDLGRQHDQIEPGYLELRQPHLDVRFRGGGPRAAGAPGAAGGDAACRPEELVLNPELDGKVGLELFRGRAGVHRVEDSAAVVGKRPEDLLEAGGIRARGVVRERESDDREHLAGGRNGPLNELSARRPLCPEQLRSERQRSGLRTGRLGPVPVPCRAAGPVAAEMKTAAPGIFGLMNTFRCSSLSAVSRLRRRWRPAAG
jgi:hypothetical protein